MKDIYKFRAEKKDWHCSKPPSEYEDILALNVQVMLGDRDCRGRRVYLVKIGEFQYDVRKLGIYFCSAVSSAVCSHPTFCTAVYRERRYQML
jgi:hypothetical protein